MTHLRSDAEFWKHRRMSVVFQSDFTNQLDTGDALDSVQNVVVAKPSSTISNEWEDVSSQFGSPSGTVSGTKVQYTLGAAGTAGHQEPRTDYQIRVEVTTQGGETLVDIISLEVKGLGDPGSVA